jgi:serine protease Do
MSSPRRSGVSRETRLLAATIVVSLVVLLVLSRFRFPDAAGAAREGAAAQPLARLAARAAFDDLSLAVRELSARVDGSLVVVRVAPGTHADEPDRTGTAARLVPALRVRDDAAVVALGEGATIEGIVGVPGPAPTIARDPVRGLALVRVPATAAPVLSIREGVQPLATPGYVAVTEASVAGASLRPIFVGRSDAVTDPRWDTPLFTMGRGAAGDVGAPVFMLDGRLAGVLTQHEGEPAVIPAQVVLSIVDQLLRGGVMPQGDIGISSQAVDRSLAAATGVSTGAAVAAVRAEGPAADVLAPGDVITAVNGQPMRSPDALRLRVARTAPGTTLALTVRRAGAFVTVPVTVREAPSRAAAAAARQEAAPATAPRVLGLTLRAVPGSGSEVLRVQPGSAADAAGLRAGDLVASLGRSRAPAPGDIAAAFGTLAADATLYLSIQREGQPRLVALQR